MIKVHDNIVTREPLPLFLRGLRPESLLDLSWTDPALGVSDAAWWPEENGDGELPADHKWGDEILTLDVERKVVIVTHEVVPLTAEEIAERDEANRKALVPASVGPYQARAALLAAGLLDAVEALIADPETDRAIRIAWEYAAEFQRDSQMITTMASVLGLTEQQVDDLFIAAAQVRA